METSGTWRGSDLPVMGMVESKSFARSKCVEDETFVEFLGTIGRKELLDTIEFRLAEVSRLDSLVKEVLKYDREYAEPAADIKAFAECACLDIVRKWTWMNLKVKEPLRFLTPEEAFNTMDLTRSPGYPWRNVAVSKEELVSGAFAPLLWERVQDIWTSLREDSPMVESLWYAFLKEELRPLAKLDLKIPAIRSISGAPVDLSVVGNQLCHDFNEAFYGMHRDILWGSVVGMSPFHGGWNHIAQSHWHDGRHTRENSTSIDVSQWDRSFSPYLFGLVSRIRGEVAKSHGTVELASASGVLEALYREVVHAAVVVPMRSGSDVVRLDGGMKSGWVNTTTDNTLGHMIVLITFMFHNGIAQEIGKGVLFSLYGDDNLLSWNDALSHVFDPVKIEQWYGAWGFTTHGVTVVRGEERYKQVFLGGSFHKCLRTGVFVYRPESGQKAIDSVRFRFRNHNVAFQRVCSLRILHFYNEGTFSVLDQYAKFLVQEGHVSSELLPNYLDGNSIVALHTGRENSDGCLFTPALDELSTDLLLELWSTHRDL